MRQLARERVANHFCHVARAHTRAVLEDEARGIKETLLPNPRELYVHALGVEQETKARDAVSKR